MRKEIQVEKLIEVNELIKGKAALSFKFLVSSFRFQVSSFKFQVSSSFFRDSPVFACGLQLMAYSFVFAFGFQPSALSGCLLTAYGL